jgi:hypothetical protein
MTRESTEPTTRTPTTRVAPSVPVPPHREHGAPAPKIVVHPQPNPSKPGSR